MPQQQIILAYLTTNNKESQLVSKMTSATMSATVARRLHYQTQASTASNQSYLSNTNDSTSFNESFSSSALIGNPLVTIIYANTLLGQGRLKRKEGNYT